MDRLQRMYWRNKIRDVLQPGWREREFLAMRAMVDHIIAEHKAGRTLDRSNVPEYVGIGEGPGDLGLRNEDYLRNLSIDGR